jgi:hypothetical protein
MRLCNAKRGLCYDKEKMRLCNEKIGLRYDKVLIGHF